MAGTITGVAPSSASLAASRWASASARVTTIFRPARGREERPATTEIGGWRRMTSTSRLAASAMPTAFGILRTTLAGATWGSVFLALITHDKRWFAASALFGAMWFVSDALAGRVFLPLA